MSYDIMMHRVGHIPNVFYHYTREMLGNVGVTDTKNLMLIYFNNSLMWVPVYITKIYYNI